MSRSTRWINILSVVFMAACPSLAAEPTIDFNRDIRPLLSNNCYACHGPDDEHREGGFRLDREHSALGEADSGEHPLVPGDPDASQLYVRISTEDEDLRMPPADSNKTLTPEQIELIRKWIEQGAAWQTHWAFRVPQQRKLPEGNNKQWPRSPIDCFILARLEKEGLTPSAPANKETLIRRVTFDLTGLPPTRAEVNAFLADHSPKAYEHLVERLLKSPRYGEHMARFWLDAARYGDTHGLHLDNYREMWPYRDWVVRAFNENMPFDQFTTEQLAGDLLPNPTLDQLVATGFNRCHVTTNEGGSIKDEVHVRNVIDRVVTTGTVFLGMTFECTRCHDHKYDPFTMDEFYSLFAFFNSIDGNAMDGNRKDHAPVARLTTPVQSEQLATLRQQIDEAQGEIQDKLAAISDVEPSEPLLAWEKDQRAVEKSTLPKEIQKIIARVRDQRDEEQRRQLRDYFLEHVYATTRDQFEPIHKRLKIAKQAMEKIEKSITTTLIFRERKEPRPAYYLFRGEYDQRRHQVQRGTPAALPAMPEGAPMNRLGLVQWLVDPSNPLTARVAVNRFWQQLFGMGIVKTAEDFGSQGDAPSHPDLLDWLACQLMENDWDVKWLMKQIVMSATYRQSSRVTPQLVALDPENRMLARGPRYRLDAEMLRDQALAVSGLLVEKMGGPSVKPPQPDGLWFAVGYSGSNTVRFKQDEGHDKLHRRTLYTFIKRTSPPPQMSTFDAPSREACTMRRERTNTPLQALLLMNDPQYVEAACALAERTLREGGQTPESRADFMFRLCTARKPDHSEVSELVGVYRDTLSVFQADSEAAESLLGVGETNREDQFDSGQLAAWTMVANLVLNLDEVVCKN